MALDDPIDFGWEDGVRVVGTAIWCDAKRHRELCFVSHALKPLGWERRQRTRVVTTERTVTLARAGRAQLETDFLLTPFGRPFALGRARLELFPSGRLPGAAQLVVEVEGRRLLYAGDVNPTPSRTVEAAQVRGGDAMVLEAPLAPFGPLPPRPQAEEQLIGELERALAAGRTPVVFCAPLGEAEELVALLSPRFELQLHRQIADYAAAYRQLGCLPAATPIRRWRKERTRPATPSPDVLLWPMERRHDRALTSIERPYLLLASGLGLAPQARDRYGVDVAVPLADSGDLPSLVEHAVAAGVREVYFTVGFTEEVARAFAARRIRAQPLLPPEQMNLGL